MNGAIAARRGDVIVTYFGLVVLATLVGVAMPRLFSRPAMAPAVAIQLAISPQALAEGGVIRVQAPMGKAFQVDGSYASYRAQSGYLVRSAGQLLMVGGAGARSGCSLNYEPGSPAVLADPCWGTRYSLDGMPMRAAGQRPLPRLAWRLTGRYSIEVKLGT